MGVFRGIIFIMTGASSILTGTFINCFNRLFSGPIMRKPRLFRDIKTV